MADSRPFFGNNARAPARPNVAGLKGFSPQDEAAQLQDLKRRIHRKLLERLNLSNLENVSREQATEAIRTSVQDLLSAETVAINMEERERLVRQVLDEIFGLGPLEPLMQDPEVSDILVNTHKQVYVERHGKL